MEYKHNSLNLLTQVGLAGITPHITYTYDGLGRRSTKTVSGEYTSYLYDGNEVIAEYDDMGNITKRFIYGAGIDNPIAYISGNTTYYYHTDEIGSVVAMSNSSGQLVETYTYGPFGQSYDSSSIGNPLRYAARRLDSETGHYYNRARYYEPKWGKFLQADPLGYKDGMNRYAYVGHNPVSFVDPMGTIAVGGGFSTESGMVSTDILNVDTDSWFSWGEIGQGALNAAGGFVDEFTFGLTSGISASLGVDSSSMAYQVGGYASMVNPAGLVKAGIKNGIGEGLSYVTKRVKEFDTVPYRPTNSPFVNHHGVNDVWAKNNIPGYPSRAVNNPTMVLSVSGHKAAHRAGNDYLRQTMGSVGAKLRTCRLGKCKRWQKGSSMLRMFLWGPGKISIMSFIDIFMGNSYEFVT